MTDCMNKKKIIRAVTVSISTPFFIDVIPALKEKGYEVLVLSSPGKELDDLKAKDVATIEVPMERHISIVKDMKALIFIIKTFRREKPGMVHSMTPKAGLLCMLAAWLTRVPLRIHTFTGLVWPTSKGIQRKILMFTDWLTCACATHIIPEGYGIMADLQKHITRKPMKVLGYGNVKGIDLKRFSLRPEIIKKAEELKVNGIFTFLFVGRLVGDKGINELVEAFVRLQSEIKNTRLLLVGTFEDKLDPLNSDTLQAIHSIDKIKVLGVKKGDELIAYYAASDCFVLPSYREGFPNTLLEAGAMGLPLIVTDINGSREIVEDGKNGIIISPKDSDALYYAMKDIVEKREKRALFASNARQMISSRFEQGFVHQCLLNFYDEIL